MLVDKKEYIDALIEPIKSIRRSKKIKSVIFDNLVRDHGFYAGQIEETLNDPENKLDDLLKNQLYLIGKQVFLQTRDMSIDPEKFFTPIEIRKAEAYIDQTQLSDEATFPMIFENARHLGGGEYLTYITTKRLKKLLDAKKLPYNYAVQRESEKVIDHYGNIKERPKIYMHNVKEMKELIKSGKLKPTQIVINAKIRTADCGDEITYNADDYTLIINEGTILNVVDGYHRSLASQMALEEKPDAYLEFPLLLTNYTDEEAQQYQAQFAKGMRISEVRQKALDNTTGYGNVVIGELKSRSELKDRISEEKEVRHRYNELVTHGVLLDAIEESFEMETKRDAHNVADYLIEVFDYIIGEYKTEFIKEVNKTQKHSLINVNDMFAGYVVLAARMMKQGLSPREILKYMDNIDFSRDNNDWNEIGVLRNGALALDLERRVKRIMNYFRQIEL